MVTDFDACKRCAYRRDDGKIVYPFCSVVGLRLGSTDEEVSAWLDRARSDAASVGAAFELDGDTYVIVWPASTQG
jgi:hypothetical protein